MGFFGLVGKSEDTAMVEKSTGTRFDGQFCQRGGSRCAPLSGVGVRAKNIVGIKVKVYAAGMYVDEQGAKGVLGKYKAEPAHKLKGTQQMYTDLVNAQHVDKTVQLVFARGVKGETMKGAFDERLKPTLNGTKEMAAFQKYFDGLTLEKGQRLSFSAVGGTLVTKLDKTTLGSIKSAPLCKAIFNSYMGSDPVSQELKEAVGVRMASVLKQ